MAILKARTRKKLPSGDFALPGKRSKSKGEGGYPIEDKGHAEAALSKISAYGTSAQKRTVERRVHAKYPSMNIKGESKSDHKARMNKWAEGK